jgi:hypothetical protein
MSKTKTKEDIEKDAIDSKIIEKSNFIDTVDAKAKSLEDKYGKITPVVITTDDGELIVGYLQAPDYDTIMYCTDKIIEKQPSLAAEQALKSCLIVEESDTRISSTTRKDAPIKVAFAFQAMSLVKPYTNEYKKK